MRKLGILVVGVLALLPLAVLADTGDATTGTLTLTGIIYIHITEEWDNLEITQDLIETMKGDYFAWGDLSVNVKAMTNYRVWGSYYAKEGGNDVDPAFGAPNHLIALVHTTDGTFWLPYNDLSGQASTEGFNYSGDYSNMVSLFTGSNNMPAGDDKTYDVQLDPSGLGDREAGEIINFTIVLVVEDNST